MQKPTIYCMFKCVSYMRSVVTLLAKVLALSTEMNALLLAVLLLGKTCCGAQSANVRTSGRELVQVEVS